MIADGGPMDLSLLKNEEFDLFFFGLGYESRATTVVSRIGLGSKVYGLTMPGRPIHSLSRNVEFSKRNEYRIIDDFSKFAADELQLAFTKRRGRGPLRIGFDISSVNRLLLIGLLHELAMLAQPDDEVTLFYTPAAYADPSWAFPQIQKVGPVNELFSGFDGDLSKPLAAMLGLGFEAGVSMGIISQLEPNASVCLWGKGIDARFDAAVKTANFDFSYPGFATRVLQYSLIDPRGSFDLLESITYDIVQDHRLVVVPMGPKLFTALAALLAMTYFGEVSIWRVQHSHVEPVDAVATDQCIYANVRTEGLVEYARKASSVLGAIS